MRAEDEEREWEKKRKWAREEEEQEGRGRGRQEGRRAVEISAIVVGINFAGFREESSKVSFIQMEQLRQGEKEKWTRAICPSIYPSGASVCISICGSSLVSPRIYF